MAGGGLAERKVIRGITDGPELEDGLKDRQQIEIKTAQTEHGRGPLPGWDG